MSETGAELQDFSAIGIDAETAEMFRSDIAPDNPDRLENAGIWAGILVEGALQVAEGSPVEGVLKEGFLSYLSRNLKPIKAETEENERINTFVWSLNYNEIAERYRTRLSDDPMNDEVMNWTVPIPEVETFVTRVMKSYEGHVQADEPYSDYHEQGAEMTADELAELLERIKNNPKYDEETPDYITREIMARHEFLSVVESIAGGLEDGPKLQERFGAKAANLIRFEQALVKLREQDVEIANEMIIPSFKPVGAEVYDAWSKDEDIEEEVTEILAWINENPDSHYIVRSSAVYSEDGEHVGAGVYESTLLSESPNAQQVLEAIEKVYESVDRPEAHAYRKEIGVDKERMGLVIQEAADGYIGWSKLGTINTVMNGVPELMDYSVQYGPHPLAAKPGDDSRRYPFPLSRTGALKEFGLSDQGTFSERFHVPPDTSNRKLSDSYYASQAAILAEKIMGRPVQMEFALPEAGRGIYILQSRPLSEQFLERKKFSGFPHENERPFYEGRAVGVLDGVSAMADSSHLNNIDLAIEEFEESEPAEADHILFFIDGSYGTGNSSGEITNKLMSLSEEQRSKIIMLIGEKPVNSQLNNYGHLETLFTELGVNLIYYGNAPGSGGIYLEHGQKLKVYSNGYEGKIYLAD